MTKYYYAGGQRVAMRKYTIPQPMTVEYFLGDHLGSTSITTDTNGGLVSELRYKPWGEVRYNSGVTPTKYQFTGQMSYASDFGLLFYNARMYDPALGRFTSADSIVPGGVQGLDRYAYGLNNPSRYIDPSGHVTCSGANWDDGPQCTSKAEFKSNATSELQKVISDRYNWRVALSFSLNYLINIYQTGMDIERYIDHLTGGSGLAWMNKNLGEISIRANFTCLIKISLPYMNDGLQWMKLEKWLKIEVLFQSVLEPVQAQTKETFINALIPINQSRVV